MLNTWREIHPVVKVQNSFNSKKMRKIFEPRMAHTSLVLGNYLVVFGGYKVCSDQYAPNNICLLSLSGCTDYILSKPYTFKMLCSLRKQSTAVTDIIEATTSNLKIKIDL